MADASPRQNSAWFFIVVHHLFLVLSYIDILCVGHSASDVRVRRSRIAKFTSFRVLENKTFKAISLSHNL